MGTMSLGFSEKLIMRFGPRTTLIPGVIMVGIGLLLFARTPVDGDYLTDLLAPLLLIGLGVGTSFPSLMTLAMSGATPEDSGLASGVVNTSMQVGGAIGLAVLATLAAERTDNKLADGAGQLAALNSGYHLAYVIGAILVGIAVVIAVTVLREVPMPSPEEMAEHARRRARARAGLLRGLIAPSGALYLAHSRIRRTGTTAWSSSARRRSRKRRSTGLGPAPGPACRLGRLGVAAEAAQQVGAGGVEGVVVVEALDRVDQLQAPLGPVAHRHRDRAVELDHRAWRDLEHASRRGGRCASQSVSSALAASAWTAAMRAWIVYGPPGRRLPLRARAPGPRRSAPRPRASGPGPRAGRSRRAASRRAGRRASVSSISASRPRASGSRGSIATRMRARRIASPLSSVRTSSSPDAAR